MSAMEQEPSGVKRDRYRIEVKVTEAQKDLVVRAAAAAGQGISEFVRSAAEKAAVDVLGKDNSK